MVQFLSGEILSIPDLRFYAREPGRTVLLRIHSRRLGGGAAFPRRSTEGGPPSYRNEGYRTQIDEKIKREGEIRRAKNEEEKMANKKEKERDNNRGRKELYLVKRGV